MQLKFLPKWKVLIQVISSIGILFITAILICRHVPFINKWLLTTNEAVLYAQKTGQTQCEKHGTALTIDTVPIVYGLVDYDFDFEKKEFPNGKSVVFGGCFAQRNRWLNSPTPRYAKVLYCQNCRQLEKAYFEKIAEGNN